MPNQHLLTCKSHYALCTSHFALCSFEIETLSKPSPKSPLEKFRGAKSSDRSDPDRAVFSPYCPNSWQIESTAVPSRDTKRHQAKFPCRKKFNRVYKSYAQSTPCKASVLVSFLMCEKASQGNPFKYAASGGKGTTRSQLGNITF